MTIRIIETRFHSFVDQINQRIDMRIGVSLPTRNIDYSGFRILPKKLKITDLCLKLHSLNKLEGEYRQIVLLYKINENYLRNVNRNNDR